MAMGLSIIKVDTYNRRSASFIFLKNFAHFFALVRPRRMSRRRSRAKTGGKGSRRRLKMITAAAGMDPSARARKAGEMRGVL